MMNFGLNSQENFTNFMRGKIYNNNNNNYNNNKENNIIKQKYFKCSNEFTNGT